MARHHWQSDLVKRLWGKQDNRSEAEKQKRWVTKNTVIGFTARTVGSSSHQNLDALG